MDTIAREMMDRIHYPDLTAVTSAERTAFSIEWQNSVEEIIVETSKLSADDRRYFYNQLILQSLDLFDWPETFPVIKTMFLKIFEIDREGFGQALRCSLLLNFFRALLVDDYHRNLSELLSHVITHCLISDEDIVSTLEDAIQAEAL